MKRTITVRGQANLAVAPDTIVLNLDFNVIKADYDLAREVSLSINNQVIKIAKANGLTAKDVKTSSYSIETAYKSVKTNNGWENQFEGYKLIHKMNISFDIDAERLGRIIKGVNKCDVIPDLSIEYTVKDATDAKEQLLALAVKSSQSKATAITSAAGVHLGDVVSINYSWSEMHIISDRYDTCYESNNEYESSAINITPEDIDISDSVTIVWELK